MVHVLRIVYSKLKYVFIINKRNEFIFKVYTFYIETVLITRAKFSIKGVSYPYTSKYNNLFMCRLISNLAAIYSY